MTEIQQGGCIEQEHAQKRKKYNLGCSGKGSYLILTPISAMPAPNLARVGLWWLPSSHMVSSSPMVLNIGDP